MPGGNAYETGKPCQLHQCRAEMRISEGMSAPLPSSHRGQLFINNLIKKNVKTFENISTAAKPNSCFLRFSKLLSIQKPPQGYFNWQIK